MSNACDPHPEIKINWQTIMVAADHVGGASQPPVKISKHLGSVIDTPWPTEVYLCDAQIGGVKSLAPIVATSYPGGSVRTETSAQAYFSMDIDEIDIKTGCNSELGDSVSASWHTTFANMAAPNENHINTLILPVRQEEHRIWGSLYYAGWHYETPRHIGTVQRDISRLSRLSVTIANEAGQNPFNNVLSLYTNTTPQWAVSDNNILYHTYSTSTVFNYETFFNDPSFSCVLLLKRPCDGKK
jgi:hypothetical protein